MLYNYPIDGVQDWRNNIDPTILRTIIEGTGMVSEWDIDAYLPSETYEVCQNYFQSINFDIETAIITTSIERANPFLQVYLGLRTKLQEYIEQGRSPELNLLSVPTGSYDWISTLFGNMDNVTSVHLPLDEEV
jgi:hypothetical protein